MGTQTALARIWLLVGALAASLAAASASDLRDAAADTHSGGFCKPEASVRDYLGPLGRFPQTKGFPESGRLRGGPKTLRVFPPRERLIAIGRDQFEARGALGHEPPRPPAPLGWWVSSRLERIVDGGGDEDRIVKAKRQYVATVNSFRTRNFGFGSHVAPGVYRLDVSFQSKRGRPLSEYQEYFRAVKAHSNLKLSTNPSNLSPGAAGFLRIENYGTVSASYSYQYRMWRVGDGRKSEVPSSPQVYSGDRPLVRAGRTGKCIQFSVPADAQAGDYQVGLEATDPLSSERVLLLAPFRVKIP